MSGLIITLTYTDETSENVAFNDFESFNPSKGSDYNQPDLLSTSPVHGAILTTTSNGVPVTITFNRPTNRTTTNNLSIISQSFSVLENASMITSELLQHDLHSIHINFYNLKGVYIGKIILDDMNIKHINELKIPYSTAWVTVEPYRNNGQTNLDIAVNGNKFASNQNIIIIDDTTTISIESTDVNGQIHNLYNFVLTKMEPKTSININNVYLFDIENGNMDPPAFFAEDIYTLTIKIPRSVNAILLNIAAENPYAQVLLYENGLLIPFWDNIPLSSDHNTFTIKVIAEDGSEQEYTLNVIRSETYSDDTNINEAYISAYDADDEWIDTIVASPNTSDNINVSLPENTAYYMVFAETADYYSSFAVMADGNMIDFTDGGGILPGQNAVIRVTAEDGVTTRDYNMLINIKTLIYGDVNGDNEVNMADLVLLARYIAGLEMIDTALLSAADVNKDNRVNIADLIRLARYLAGIDDGPLG